MGYFLGTKMLAGMGEQGSDCLLFRERLFGEKLTISKPGTSQRKNKNKERNQ